MALGDLKKDLNSLPMPASVTISNSGKYVVALHGGDMMGATNYYIYNLETDALEVNTTLPSITGLSITIAGSEGNEKVIIGDSTGNIHFMELSNMITEATNVVTDTFGVAAGKIPLKIKDNGLDFNNPDFRLGVFYTSQDNSDIMLLNPSNFSIVNSVSYASADVSMIEDFDLLYDENVSKTTLIYPAHNVSTSTYFLQLIVENEAIPAQIEIQNADLISSVITNMSTFKQIKLYKDSATEDKIAKLLLYGFDESGGGQDKYSEIIDFNIESKTMLNSFTITETAYNTDGQVINTAILDKDTVIANKNATDIVEIQDLNTVITTVTNIPKFVVSNNSEVFLILEITGYQTQDEQISDLKVYEGIIAASEPSLNFPVEENIYFFNANNELITELDVGQLSPIKDTAIYSVQIATNVTSNTFESITLGTTQNNVNCLMSATEDPFENLEEITIPFTNADVITVYLKLATNEVQTVGNATLELLVIGNVDSTA